VLGQLNEAKSKVIIIHNDNTQQENRKAAQKQIKILVPLIAMDQILQHVLPRHFQKSRSYGLNNTNNKHKAKKEASLKDNTKG
jgi:hypothetical protein